MLTAVDEPERSRWATRSSARTNCHTSSSAPTFTSAGCLGIVEERRAWPFDFRANNFGHCPTNQIRQFLSFHAAAFKRSPWVGRYKFQYLRLQQWGIPRVALSTRLPEALKGIFSAVYTGVGRPKGVKHGPQRGLQRAISWYPGEKESGYIIGSKFNELAGVLWGVSSAQLAGFGA